MNTNQRHSLSATLMLAAACLSPLAQAGDVKTYAAAGICNAEFAKYNGGGIGNWKTNSDSDRIFCTVPRDLPQKGRVRSVNVQYTTYSTNPAAAGHGCYLSSRATDGSTGSITVYLPLEPGPGTRTLEWKNQAVIRHGGLALSCLMPYAGTIRSFTVDE